PTPYAGGPSYTVALTQPRTTTQLRLYNLFTYGSFASNPNCVELQVYPPAGPTLTVAGAAGTAASVFANADGGGDGVAGGGSFTITDNDHQDIGLITLDQIEITASGSGDDSTAFDEVAIYRDH